MNAYVLAATDETLTALRGVVGRAAQAVTTSGAVAIITGENVLMIEAEPQDLERNFECYRLTARMTNVPPIQRPTPLGKIVRIELLTTEEWIEAADGDQPPRVLGKVQAYQYAGYPGSAPQHALAKCLADDAVLIVGADRELLVRCDVMSYQVTWSTDGAEIATHMAERQSRILPAG